MPAEEPKNVKILLKYFISVRDKTGKKEESAEFSAGSTLADVAAWLNKHYGFTLPDPRIIATLNGKGWEQHQEKLSTELHEGDTVCLFPPISGG